MRHLTLALFMVAACAAPQPNPSPIGLGGITGSTGPTGTPSLPAPTITESTPPSGAKNIAPLVSVKVRFSAAMDPGTINRTTVRTYEVGDGSNYTKASVLTLSTDGKELTIKANFNYGVLTRVTFNGVKDAAGTALAKQTLEWLPTSPYDYVESINAAGQVTEISTREYAANGVMSRYTIYDGRGVDNTWRTADDVVDKTFVYVSNADGFTQEVVTHNAAGTDGVWKTSDDVISEISTYERAPDGQLTRLKVFNGAGPDGSWRTADDTLSTYATYTYDANGDATSYQYFSAGPDTQWFTADDVKTSQQLYQYNTTFDTIAELDGLSDYETLNERDQRGNIVGKRSANRGPDGLSKTADDIVSALETATFSDIYYTSFEFKNGAGALLSYRVIAWDETINAVSEYTHYSGVGPDGVKATADDPISSHQKLVFNGGIGVVTTYNAAGPDGLWKTSDDIPSSRAYRRAGF